MIDVTEGAVGAVEQAEAAARRFNPQACIRLVRAGGGVRFALSDGPEPTDVPVACGRATLYVEVGLEDGRLDTGEHNAPVLITH